jgi:hypothetical protein
MKTNKTTKKKEKVVVTIIEHDSWSGPKVSEKREFATKASAEKFCKKFNSKNKLSQVPDFYEIAHMPDDWFLTIRR